MPSAPILLRRVDPAKRVYRWYSVNVQATLFEQVAVICAWGSLRTDYACQRAISCGSEAEARERAGRIVERKIRKGYVKWIK